MIDIDTHRIIDLLPSREIQDVAEWLSSFPNLEIVSRDGPVSYNSAVKQADKKIIQISGRFHLIKGLTDAAKKVITALVAANIGIPVSASHYEGNATIDYWDKEMKRQDFPTREHDTNCEKKRKTIDKVAGLTNQDLKCTGIASELGISYSTVKRYQSPAFNPVHGKYNTARPSKIKPHAEKIKQMLKSEELKRWLKEAEALEIEQINSFVNGIRRDIDAVKRAIELDYNNGLAEGSVNKLKVIKRIMYGRNSFSLLKGKLLRLELKR